jgi:hypothetical protein
MLRTCLLAAVVLTTSAAVLDAQPFPRLPFPPPGPQPVPPASGSPVDGQWYFRGDPSQPCFIQTVGTPAGPAVLFTNEKGTPAYGQVSPDGRWVTIPDWNLTGTIRWNRIIWPNGDFWAR